MVKLQSLFVPYHTRQEALLRSEILHIPCLSGPIESMYPIDDQCRIELVGKMDDACGTVLTRWIYRITMPLMCVTAQGAARSLLHFDAALDTPFSEEKMRFGCQLHADCLVLPRSAVILAPGVYRILYDARVDLHLQRISTGCA